MSSDCPGAGEEFILVSVLAEDGDAFAGGNVSPVAASATELGSEDGSGESASSVGATGRRVGGSTELGSVVFTGVGLRTTTGIFFLSGAGETLTGASTWGKWLLGRGRTIAGLTEAPTQGALAIPP
jgi:hypothetical protein